MAPNNRTLQRVPPITLQRTALMRRKKLKTVVSDDPTIGMLQAQLELVQEADSLHDACNPQPGPKPKRETLIRILEVLEREKLPIRTSEHTATVNRVACILNRSPLQVRDLLHQLADMVERTRPVSRYFRMVSLRAQLARKRAVQRRPAPHRTKPLSLRAQLARRRLTLRRRL